MCCVLFINKDNTLFLNRYNLRVYMVHIPQRISVQDFFPAAGVDTALT